MRKDRLASFSCLPPMKMTMIHLERPTINFRQIVYCSLWLVKASALCLVTNLCSFAFINQSLLHTFITKLTKNI